MTDAIAAHKPDAVLVDVNSWGALAAAEHWGGQWATFCPYPLAMSSVDTPPFGLGLPPAGGPLGRTRDRALRPIVYAMLNKAMLPGVNTVRAQYGLAPLRHLDEQFTRPPLLIYMTAEPFEYPRGDWPANLVAVGPCEWEPASDVPDGLRDSRLVVVTSSSEFQKDDGLLRITAAALAEEKVTVVLTAPAHGQLGDLPENVVSVQFAPHGPLLDKAVCAITHTGWARHRRHWPAACRWSPCRSGATSSRSRAGSRSPAPEYGYLVEASTNAMCAPRSTGLAR